MNFFIFNRTSYWLPFGELETVSGSLLSTLSSFLAKELLFLTAVSRYKRTLILINEWLKNIITFKNMVMKIKYRLFYNIFSQQKQGFIHWKKWYFHRLLFSLCETIKLMWFFQSVKISSYCDVRIWKKCFWKPKPKINIE